MTRGWLVLIGVVSLPVYPKGPWAFLDLDVYARWRPVLAGGAVPVDDMWQYPPLAGAFFLLAGIGSEPKLILIAAILAADLALLVILGRADRRAAWWWVLLGLVIGPVLVSRFDVVPSVFAVLAVTAAGRPAAVGIWAAVGTALKIWPVLVLPIVPRRSAGRAAVGFVTTTILLAAMAALIFDRPWEFLNGQGARGLQIESVAAVPFVVAGALGASVGFPYRFGSVEVDATGAGPAAIAVTVFAVLLFGFVAVAWWRDRFVTRAAADVAFTLVLFSVVVSRVFSPQYSIWLLGIGSLCLADARSRVRLPVGLVVVATAIAQVVYPWGYDRLVAGDPFLVGLQVVRVGLVVSAAVLAGWAVLRDREPIREPALDPLPATRSQR